MRWVWVAAVVGVLTGCSGGFDCSESSSCSADPPLDSSAIASCNAAISDAKCGSAYKALAQCFHDDATCAADGTTDQAATSATCQKQLDAYNSCTSG